MLADDMYCQQFLLKEDFKIPDQKPNIEDILNVVSEVRLLKVIFKDNKVIFMGELVIKVEYVALVEADSQPVHFVSFKVPFGNFLKLDCNKVYQKKISCKVEYKDLARTDERAIEGTIVIRVCAYKRPSKDSKLPSDNKKNKRPQSIAVTELKHEDDKVKNLTQDKNKTCENSQCDPFKCFPKCPYFYTKNS